MSDRLVAAASRVLAARVSRRGLLAKAALAGAALSVAPMRYVLRPGTAYAAICRCAGSDCDCGALCCDGYTDFCCSLYGVNTCPSGTVAAGWWKADGSGFCDAGGVSKPRYYLDCNSVDCGDCGCGSSGTCHHSCDQFTCGCGAGSCSHRKTGCTSFRYGQCNNQIECVGPIVCRVVTCTPPWEIENCSTASATDNATRSHHAPCLEGSSPSDVPLLGDWNGDGTKTPGIFRRGVWYLANATRSGGPDVVFAFGDPGDVPVVGDWSGQGRDGIGVVRGNRWFLRGRAGRGAHDATFNFGASRGSPVVGNWTGTGRTGIGWFDNGRWLQKDRAQAGAPDRDFWFGDRGDVPVVGDWDGNGAAGPGVFRRGTWLLRRFNSNGRTHIEFLYGDPADKPIAGDWNSDGVATPGIVRGSRWFLRDLNTTGAARRVINFDTAAPRAG